MKTTVIAITGPSGFNKSYLVKEALKLNSNTVLMPSYTDKPEPKEYQEMQFKYVTEDEFTKVVEAEKFLEWQRLLSNNYRYGKTKEDFSNILKNNEGKIIFTIINIINLPLLKRYHPNLKSIFVDVKDTQSLIDFLRNSPDVYDGTEFDRRYKFATEERRRRHLADITVNMDENNKAKALEDFMQAITKLAS